MIVYNKLFDRLSADGKPLTAWLRENGMHPSVVNKLRNNERVNTDTINRLCSLLNCQPGDIMEYVED